MSLLSIIQAASRKCGLPTVNTVIGNNTASVVELLNFAQEECVDQSRAGKWQEVIKEATFATVSGQEAYPIYTIAPDYDFILNQTVWNRTKNWAVNGPISPKDWQTIKSSLFVTPYDSFRIRGNDLLLYPTPSSADNIYFEYVSKNWCKTTLGAYTSAWAADTDTSLIDEYVIQLGVIWRWKAAKGLDYSADLQKWNEKTSEALARSGGSSVLSLDINGGNALSEYGNIPEGNF